MWLSDNQVTPLQAPVIMTGAFYFQGATDMPGCTSRLLPKALLLPNGI
ncbi:hypothetical protein G0T45_000634 [Escherichia coli]|nr:hypothetical protein [Escherichia coli]